MTAVHATWLNARTSPIFVTGDETVYNAIRAYLGQYVDGGDYWLLKDENKNNDLQYSLIASKYIESADWNNASYGSSWLSYNANRRYTNSDVDLYTLAYCFLADNGKGLNLTYAVRDGIVCHNGESLRKRIKPSYELKDLDSITEREGLLPSTYEGAVVRFSDSIAYLGRDWEDAYRLGILKGRELPEIELPGGKRCFCTIPEEAASPYILHAMFPGVESGVLVRMLSEAGVMVAAGSACSSETGEPSAALRALGFRGRDVWSGLRVSLSPESTADDAKKFVEALRNVLKNW